MRATPPSARLMSDQAMQPRHLAPYLARALAVLVTRAQPLLPLLLSPAVALSASEVTSCLLPLVQGWQPCTSLQGR